MFRCTFSPRKSRFYLSLFVTLLISHMATCYAPVSISGGSFLKGQKLCPINSDSFGKTPILKVQRKSNQSGKNRKISLCAQYGEGGRGGGGDFLAGFVLGGAVCGTLAYIFAPQIRRSLLNEDESGFKRARGPIYYDEGLEETRQTLNDKIGQLNSAIDNVSSRLRGSKNLPPRVPVESDPEIEATI